MEDWEKDVISEFLESHFPQQVTQHSLRYYVGQSLALNELSQVTADFIISELKEAKRIPVSMMVIPRSDRNLPFGVTGGYQRKTVQTVTADLFTYAILHQEQRLKKNVSMRVLRKVNEKELRRSILENCEDETFKYWWT